MGKEPVSAFWSWPYHPFLVGSIQFLTTIRTYTSKHRYDRNEAVETRLLFFSKGWPKWAEHFLCVPFHPVCYIKHASTLWKKPCFSLVSEFQTAAFEEEEKALAQTARFWCGSGRTDQRDRCCVERSSRCFRSVDDESMAIFFGVFLCLLGLHRFVHRKSWCVQYLDHL